MKHRVRQMERKVERRAMNGASVFLLLNITTRSKRGEGHLSLCCVTRMWLRRYLPVGLTLHIFSSKLIRLIQDEQWETDRVRLIENWREAPHCRSLVRKVDFSLSQCNTSVQRRRESKSRAELGCQRGAEKSSSFYRKLWVTSAHRPGPLPLWLPTSFSASLGLAEAAGQVARSVSLLLPNRKHWSSEHSARVLIRGRRRRGERDDERVNISSPCK